ncbi:Transposase IS4 [Popillia japonica]|uniref:Transposase IS4 n=1 Tax=Popillia japonica TaxID=7064 RepID=A0AAW1N558_POPJA
MSGFVVVPRRRLYWGQDKNAHNEVVAESITRDKFDFILSHIHVVDNENLDPKDKFAKVRPLFAKLKSKLLEHAPFEEGHSVDEAMVPYYVKHGCKQFLHGKPIRYGYKIWVGATRLCYVVWLKPYQGASTNISEAYAEYGLGAGVVLEFVDALRSKLARIKFHFFLIIFLHQCH